jgi:hypothetical protein
MRTTNRVGLGLLTIAAVSWCGWTLWSNTRRWCPVDIPISLTKGSHTQTEDFKLNVSGPYEIEVEAEAGKGRIPFNALTCSLGVGAIWPEKTCTSPSILELSWVLTSDGKVVARGSSDDTTGGGSSSTSAMRTIGYFRGQRGQRYQLSVNALADASSLAAANPRLRVNVVGTIYEFNLVVSGLVNLGSAGIAVIGAILLLGSLIVHRGRVARALTE